LDDATDHTQANKPLKLVHTEALGPSEEAGAVFLVQGSKLGSGLPPSHAARKKRCSCRCEGMVSHLVKWSFRKFFVIAIICIIPLMIWIAFYPNPFFCSKTQINRWLTSIENRQLRDNTASALYTILNSRVPDVQDIAFQGLTSHEPERAIALGKVLRFGATHARGRAALELRHLGRHAIAALPDLIYAVDDSEKEVRCRAIRALGNLGSAAGSAEVIIRMKLASPDIDTRLAAAAAVFKLTGDLDAIPLLREALSSSNEYLRIEAAESMIEIGKFDDIVETICIEILRGKSYYDGIRQRAIFCLERAGPLSPESLAELQHAVKDQDWLIFTTAIECLVRQGIITDQIIEVPTRLLSHFSNQLRLWAAKTLGSLGPRAIRAAPELLEATRDSDDQVRSAAADALKRIQG